MRKFQLSQCRVLISDKSENCHSFNRCGARPTCFQSKFWYLKGCLTDDSMKRQFRAHLEIVELQKTCFLQASTFSCLCVRFLNESGRFYNMHHLSCRHSCWLQNSMMEVNVMDILGYRKKRKMVILAAHPSGS